ncbi:unnamed protein product, partial [Linum tenue]
ASSSVNSKWQPDVHHHLQVFQPRVSCWATPIPRMDHVLKSVFSKDNVEHVTAEETLKSEHAG